MIIALLGLFLALPLAPAASALPVDTEDAAAAQPTSTSAPAPTTTKPGVKIEDPPTEADEAESRKKLIMGAASVVLLGLVIWGRSIRRKRKKAAEGGG
jgi:hypothetical protein